MIFFLTSHLYEFFERRECEQYKGYLDVCAKFCSKFFSVLPQYRGAHSLLTGMSRLNIPSKPFRSTPVELRRAYNLSTNLVINLLVYLFNPVVYNFYLFNLFYYFINFIHSYGTSKLSCDKPVELRTSYNLLVCLLIYLFILPGYTLYVIYFIYPHGTIERFKPLCSKEVEVRHAYTAYNLSTKLFTWLSINLFYLFYLFNLSVYTLYYILLLTYLKNNFFLITYLA